MKGIAIKPLRLPIVLALTLLLPACLVRDGQLFGTLPARTPDASAGTATLTPFQPSEPYSQSVVLSLPEAVLPTATTGDPLLWVSPAAPDYLRRYVQASGLPQTGSFEAAAMRLEVGGEFYPNATDWIYALVAPFPSLVEAVSEQDLRSCWEGVPSGPFAGQPLWMAPSTLEAFSSLWGAPAAGAVVLGETGQLVSLAWNDQPSWAIVPFEELEPRWKVLPVDGQSPIHRDFSAEAYPLKIRFTLQQSLFPPLPPNRDPSRLTVLAMTGVTALVRATADRMERHGVLYPGEAVREVLRAADVTHISNEIPFMVGCPTPDPFTSSLRFCSDPRYIELLEDVGADVIELTGNHMLDYGPDPFLYTLDLYKARGWLTFGGGRDLEDSLLPALVTDHGNLLAFIGCNFAGPTGDLATSYQPGSTPCELDAIRTQIARLAEMGFLPIMTFQYYEYYHPDPSPEQRQIFRSMAEAGAIIVSGSQAHVPAGMEFSGDRFIHYGLGNLFFDQMAHLMDDGSTMYDTRNVMIDRHVIYDGRHISTELLTFILEDYSRPRPMTPSERSNLLRDMFEASGWR